MAFSFYSPVTVNTGQVPSTQSDFPVLISYTDARFKTVANGGHVQNSSGFDIRPYSDSALTSALTYELERYNASTGEVIMWVKRSSLADGNVTYLAYGDSSLTTDGSSTTTWSNSFVGVYHLKDGTTLSVADSLNLHNGTNHGATATAGKIDGAAAFASVSSQYIDCGNVAQNAAVTITAWINGTSFPGAYNSIGGYDNNTGTTKQAMIWVKSNGKMTFFVFGSGSIGYDGTGSHTLSTGTTYHVALTYSSAAGMVGYVNAASDGTAAANGNLVISATPTYIGEDPQTAGRFWNGMLDEFRVASVARTADWITTEYNNQNAPATFATLGTETNASAIGSFFYFFN